jgi:hypothetical protein
MSHVWPEEAEGTEVHTCMPGVACQCSVGAAASACRLLLQTWSGPRATPYSLPPPAAPAHLLKKVGSQFMTT